MDIKNVKKENGKLSFEVTVDSAAFEKAVNGAYLKAKKDLYVPGFRKGKVPRMIVENMYGKEVFYEDAIDALAPECYEAGLAQDGSRVVGAPAITNFNVDDDRNATIEFSVALYPEAKLGEYKGLEAYKAPAEATEEEVAAEMEKEQKKAARIVSVEREAAMGDTANIDFEGFKEGVPFEGGKGEGHDLVLGSGSFVPGFEEQVVGMKAGDEKDIDITFPENYHAELAGAAVVFHVKCNEVKETQLPELDDEFAKDVSEFDTIAEYTESVKAELLKRKDEAAEGEFRAAILQKAVENMEVEVPDAMIDEQVNTVVEDYARNCAMQGFGFDQYLGMMGMDDAGFRAVLRPSATNEVRTQIFLEAVAEAEGIVIGEEDIEKEYTDAAAAYSMDVEQIKAVVTPEVITRDLKMRKAADVVYQSAVATDVKPETEAAE